MSVLLIVFGMTLFMAQDNLAATQKPPTTTHDRLLITSDTLLKNRNLNHTPVHLNIGEFIDISIVDGYYNAGEWTIPTDTAAYLTNAAIPGENDNIIIYGHNKHHIFGRLSKSKVDDIISVTLADGTIREYRTTLVEHITTDRLEYLQPTETETLTIYTCAGWLDQDRFLVRALPV